MDRDTESLLALTIQSLRFATNHPYAATGIFGAVVGSAVTYKVMTEAQKRTSEVFTPKAYKIALGSEDLRHLLDEPTAEIRWETPEFSVIITSEEVIPMKQLPVIEHEDVISRENPPL